MRGSRAVLACVPTWFLTLFNTAARLQDPFQRNNPAESTCRTLSTYASPRSTLQVGADTHSQVSLKDGADVAQLEKAKKDVTDNGGKIVKEFKLIKGFR